MRRFNALVFEDVILRGVAAYSSTAYDAGIGLFDQLALHVIVDNSDGDGTLDVYVEHSGDGVNWLTKNGGSPLFTVPVTNGATTNKSGVEPDGELSMAFVRVRLLMQTTGNRVRARLYATARDKAA